VLFIFVWIFVGTHSGIDFELPDQKTQGFIVLIALKWLFLEHVRKLFGEIYVRI
jgi:hypothetical protein